MLNINFFEKKEINILPYIINTIFLVSLLGLGVYFLTARMYYGHTIDDKNEWINANNEQVSLSRQISQMDHLIDQSIDAQNTLTENQYPMNIITEDIISVIPDGINRVASFQLIESGQVSLILENTESTMGQKIVEELEYLPFVTKVQFLYAEKQNEENNQLRYELVINLNESIIIEEELK